MPARLTVVIAQSSRRDSRTVDFEESIVTRLMLASGLDVVLVSSLDNIRLDSTDHLCLHDLPEEIALLGWHELDEALTQWRRLNLSGNWTQLYPVHSANSPSHTAVGISTRRIRYVRLNSNSQADDVHACLQSVLDNRRVQAVPIQLTPKSRSRIPLAKDSAPSHSIEVTKNAAHSPLPIAAETKIPSIVAANSAQPLPIPHSHPATLQQDKSKPYEHAPSDETEHWSSLDQLVDDLDALDL